jgi:hypothetical protein
VGDDVKLNIVDSNDNRSYHISSKKIYKILGFEAKRSIKDAAQELIDAFKDGRLINTLENEMYFNIKRMQSINLT